MPRSRVGHHERVGVYDLAAGRSYNKLVLNAFHSSVERPHILLERGVRLRSRAIRAIRARRARRAIRARLAIHTIQAINTRLAIHTIRAINTRLAIHTIRAISTRLAIHTIRAINTRLAIHTIRAISTGLAIHAIRAISARLAIHTIRAISTGLAIRAISTRIAIHAISTRLAIHTIRAISTRLARRAPFSLERLNARLEWSDAILLGGAVISSISKHIRLVAQSLQEAEIYSYAYAAKDLRFIQQLLEFNGHALDLPTPILTDSAAAIPWIRNPGSTARTRHYEKLLMYGREGFLRLLSFPLWTLDQFERPMCGRADLFTKCEDKTLFLKFRSKLLGLV